MSAQQSLPSFEQFAIGFDDRDRPFLHTLWDEVLDGQVWTQGPVTETF